MGTIRVNASRKTGKYETSIGGYGRCFAAPDESVNKSIRCAVRLTIESAAAFRASARTVPSNKSAAGLDGGTIARFREPAREGRSEMPSNETTTIVSALGQ